MDQTKIWDYFQNTDAAGDIFAGARSRYEFLARHVAPGMSVLNIGVGRGGLEVIMQEKGAVVSCLDPSEKSIENLRNLLSLGGRAQVGYSQAIPFTDQRFDVVIMSEVLEHLSDDVLYATLNEVSRVLKHGGLFIGTVPADEDLAVNVVMCPHCGESFHHWGHVQTFGRDRLMKTLEMSFEKVTLVRRFFSDSNVLNWKGRVVSFLKKAAIGLSMEGNGETYFFSARKK